MSQLLPPDPALLGGITAFENLPPEVLTWLLEAGEVRQYAPSEIVVEAGAPADRMLAVVKGAMQYYATAPTGRTPVFSVEAGRVTGVLPYSRLQIFRGQGVAVGETILYQLPRSQFAALEHVSPELVQRLVGIMSDRAREEARTQERDDKLRALGKLSAGLSHELNNPAAAISRAAAALADSLLLKPQLLLDMLAACPPADAMAALTALAVLPTEAPPVLSALQASDREEELADWLETQGCPDGYTLAANLLDAGLDLDALAPVVAQLPDAARTPALTWLAGHLATLRLAHDIREASQRISTLVNDVKTYSHMDRAGGREKLAVTTGLDSTLNIFAHTLRQKNVRLTRDYAPSLPLIMGQAGSLNQVWTNLIDNALDALPDKGGELTVRVTKQSDFVCVSIQDNGSGITPEVLAHMFEPFYTTKPAGEGSGQGLDIARRIVQEHGGRLEAASQPGHTEFTTWLPIG
ncbi:sensor histidine kinase [Hymenobacter sp. BT559]|uniref:sensor histidine kinase n=1 Tax=Hymenobacter sp. BT559 TaxID=2795729 RepID=UPI0018ECB99C|nr:ATP-binding protein [Hymenobacter sp. BT559]MBJ6144289.1 cyclic nucleotide-binding domain-containing protein [Hymenobacter sp. BT559]